jgi:hypothetical protein
MGSKVRRPLNLIQDRASRELREKAARVLRRELADVRSLERDTGMFRESHTGERRLTGLTLGLWLIQN